MHAPSAPAEAREQAPRGGHADPGEREERPVPISQPRAEARGGHPGASVKLTVADTTKYCNSRPRRKVQGGDPRPKVLGQGRKKGKKPRQNKAWFPPPRASTSVKPVLYYQGPNLLRANKAIVQGHQGSVQGRQGHQIRTLKVKISDQGKFLWPQGTQWTTCGPKNPKRDNL